MFKAVDWERLRDTLSAYEDSHPLASYSANEKDPSGTQISEGVKGASTGESWGDMEGSILEESS